MVDWRRNLAFLWIAQVFSLIGFSFSLPFAPFYLQELGVTGREQVRLWSGLFAAAAGVPLAIAAPIWGALADRIGRKPMSLRASLGGALVLGAMGLVRSPQMLLVLRVLQGVFTGTIAANLTLVVSNTPERRMGFAIGIMNSAVFAGNSFGPLAGGYFADLFGFRRSFFISSLSLLISFLVTLLFVREEFSRQPVRLRWPRFRLAEAWSSWRGFLPVIGLIALLSLAGNLATPIYPLLVQEIAIPGLGVATQAGIVNAAAGLAVVLAGVLVGRLADRGGLLRLGTACAASAGVFAGTLAAARSLWALVPLRAAADFSFGGGDPILNIFLARQVGPERRGLAFGLAGSARSVAWSLGGALGGVLSAYAGFPAVFLTGGALFLTAAGFLYLRSRRVPAAGD
jgi:DHA1 family multidrug resistance protein-like MFS transporter